MPGERERDNCASCGRLAYVSQEHYRCRDGPPGTHVPYVGNWRIGRAWPISRIDRDARGRSGGPAPRVSGSDW